MISELKDVNSISQIVGLLSQLREREIDIDSVRADVGTIIASETSTILTAQIDDDIVGMAVVNIVIKVGKREARIDEVVVDESARGTGMGQKLMQAAIDWAWANQCDSIELTSRASREAANKLYQKLGFKIRKTNVYQLKRITGNS